MLKRIARLFTTEKFNPLEISNCLQEFHEGLECINNHKIPEAENKFKLCIDILSNKNLLGTKEHNYILQRLALVQRGLNLHEDCENSLETIVKNCKSNNLDGLIPATINVIKQCLNTNLPKAMHYVNSIKSFQLQEFQSEFQYLLGTSLLLNSDYAEGKSILSKQAAEETGTNRAYILHNLACGKWWHMRQFKSGNLEDQSSAEKQEFSAALSDFRSCIENFKESIALIESIDKPFNPDEHQLKSTDSSISVTNVGEIHLQYASFSNAIKWLKIAIETAVKFNPEFIIRPLTLLGVCMKFQNDKTKALKVFDQALKVMDNNNSIQKNTFHEFFLLHMYGNTLMDSGESEQAEKILERSALIQENLYIWSEKSVQLYLPIWHL